MFEPVKGQVHMYYDTFDMKIMHRDVRELVQLLRYINPLSNHAIYVTSSFPKDEPSRNTSQ